MIELLAPAGNFEALRAAVENGANAVYLAGNFFGARAFAENFTAKQMEEAVKYAHLRNVEIHVTVNTIVDNSEFENLSDYLRFLYAIGVDAIIVQDLGVAKLAKTIIPKMSLHASTQMTVHNLAGVNALAKLGFSRVVLSREVSLEDITNICTNTDIEIEIFIHGALCICYSGQCLMSSMIGGRSGNRGRCAQPCRLPYSLVNANGNNLLLDNAGEYLLSPKDLKTLEILPQLLNAGVTSLKIEGRMKRPEYVGVVVDVYRRSIDKILNGEIFSISEDDSKRIAQIFNRDFTTAFLEKNQGKNIINDKKPNNRGLLIGRVIKYNKSSRIVTIKTSTTINEGDEINFWVKVGGRVTSTISNLKDFHGNVISSASAGEVVSFPLKDVVHINDRIFRVFDKKLMEEIRSTFTSEVATRRIPVKMDITLKEGFPLLIELTSNDGYYIKATSKFIIEKAKKHAITKELLEKQLYRIGATIYSISQLNINLAKNVMIPISEINTTRREAFDLLDKKRLEKYSRQKLTVIPDNTLPKSNDSQKLTTNIVVSTDNVETLKLAISAGANEILFGGESYKHQNISIFDYERAITIARDNNIKIIFNTPRIIRESIMPSFKKFLYELISLAPDKINIHNISLINLCKEYNNIIPLQADFSLVTYNSLSISHLKELGVSKVTLSPELNMSQIEKIAISSVLPLECIVHGKLELMISEYCVLGSFLGNNHTKICSRPCEKQNYYLKDRKSEMFPIVTDQFCHMHLLNTKTLSMLPHAMEFQKLGISSIRIDAKYLSNTELFPLVKAYRKLLNSSSPLNEETKEFVTKIEGNNITRGHYFRGVL